ncbi:MAG TPA: hypothetical protein VF520_09115 [Thermoleophilaceae bacterium]
MEPSGRARLERGELAVLAALAAWSLVPLVSGLVHVWRFGGVLGGGDGVGVPDHYQYLAWIRAAGEHALVENRFDVADEPAVFLQPMWVVSGALWRLGLPVQAAFLAWKPVAVGVLFGGYLAYVRRTVSGGSPALRLAALALALLYFAPPGPLTEWLDAGSELGRRASDQFTFELSPAMSTWGYFHTSLALGLMPVYVLAAERVVAAGDRGGWGRPALAAGGAGLLVSWLHPWQGLVLLAVTAAVAAWGRGARAYRRLAAPAAAAAAPLVYYWALARTDTAWRVGREAVDAPHHLGWLLLALAPLAVPAAAALWQRRGGPPLDLQERVLVAWPVATVAVYLLLDRSFFFHAVAGATLPLAVLAVRVRLPRRLGRPALAAGAAALLVLPGMVYEARKLRDAQRSDNAAYYLREGEARALEHLDSAPGGEAPVLARFRLAEAVPGHAGRAVYVGHPSWTPSFDRRYGEVEPLFDGRLSPADARALVRRSRARLAVSDCDRRRDLRPVLGSLVVRVRRFGCATVYELGPAS